MSKEFRDRPNLDSGRVLFTVGSRSYSRSDVISAAVQRGEWSRLEDQVRAGLACVKRARSAAAPAIDIQKAAEDFRYERNLITVEETEAWLDHSGVTFDGWTAYLERSLFRQAWANEIDDIVSRFPPSDDEIVACIQAEAVCSGQLARFVETLAARAAVCEAAAAVDRDMERHDLAWLERTFQEQVRNAITPSALQSQIEAHRIDWIRIQWRYIVLTQHDIASEAALCIRHDGESLEEIARRGRTRIHEGERLLEGIEMPLRDLVLSAQPGELVGPTAADGGFRLGIIDAKHTPSLDHAETRRRAEEEAVGTLVTAGLKQVLWHQRL